MADEHRTNDVVALIDAGRDREAAHRGALHDRGSATAPALNGGTMDALAQFATVGPLLGQVVGGLSADDLDRPTPCKDFTVRGVLEHMIGGATMFTAAVRGEEPTEPDLSDPLADFLPVLGRLAEAVSEPGALERPVTAPFGEVTGDTVVRYLVVDGLVHGWDMATATGQAYDPSDAVVAEAEAFARTLIDPMRDGDTFEDAVEPAADATPIERLAAFTGRKPI